MRIRRDLGWTAGFPMQGAWHVVGLGAPAAARSVDGRDLHRATLCVRRLLAEHHAALRKVVGDEGAWAERQLALIDAVKPLLTEGLDLTRKPLLVSGRWPSALATHIRTLLESDLGDIAAALAWSQWVEPRTLTRLLRWLEAHRAPLLRWRQLGATLPLVVRFTHAAFEERDGRTANLLAWLTHRQVYGQGLERPRTKATKDTAPALVAELEELVEAIARVDQPMRRRIFDAFNLVAASSHLSRWESWYPRYERAKERVTVLDKVQDPGVDIGRARKRLDTLTKTMPRPVRGVTLKNLVMRLAAAENGELFETIHAAMRDWPESPTDGDLRFAAAAYWANIDTNLPRMRAALRQVIRRFGLLVRKRGAHAYTPWLPILRSDAPLERPAAFDFDLLAPKTARSNIDTFFTVLEAQSEPFDQEAAEHLMNLVLTLPAARVGSALEALRASPMWDEHISFNGMTVAAALTDAAPERFTQVLRTLQADDHQRVKLLTSDLTPLIGKAMLLDLLAAGHYDALIAIAERLALVRALGLRVSEAPAGCRARDWLLEHPEELQPALTYIADIDSDAEQTAERILGKNKLARELAGLRAIAQPTPAQAARRAKLEAWRPRPLSRATIDRLSRKLREAGMRRFLTYLSAQVDSAMAKALERLIGAAPPPEWLTDRDIGQTLIELAKLKQPIRALAAQLLRRRLDPRPWDMRTAPRNERFLERMVARGLNVSPWIDPDPPEHMMGTKNRPMLVGIATDPLEIFRMGAHFGTCLSPGDVNFFSVVANACDINKRVVFARDASGSVLGRVLIALTDEGALIAFHFYAHDHTAGVTDAMRVFIHALAGKIGAPVASGGHVSKLVAPEWYDDGAVDIAERHPALADGSVLRQALAHKPPAEAAHLIATAMPLTDIVLSPIFELAEVKKRPAIAAALVPHIAHLDLSRVTIVYLSHLLLQAREEVAARPFATHIASVIARDHRDAHYVPPALLRVLAHADPRLALQTLRSTRPMGTRRLRDEDDPVRLYATGVALHRLQRPRQATQALERALSTAESTLKAAAELELARIRAG